MKSANIVIIPNAVLTTPARNVAKIDKKIKDIVSLMKKTIIEKDNPKGVGLAAPQIGISLRIFITRPSESAPVSAFINPEITAKSKTMLEIARPDKNDKSAKSENKLEGCLSVPKIWGHLKRSQSVRLSYLDENGEKKEETFSGFMATIIQHEVDHLNGILFTQRVLEQKEKLYEVEIDKDGGENLAEIEI